MAIKFERTEAPIGSVEFTRAPSRGNLDRSLKFAQPKDLTDGTDVYAYDKGPTQEFFNLHWSNIPKADYDNFISFVKNIVNGVMESFTYTDIDGTPLTVRIWNGEEINSAPVAYNRESLTVVLRVEV
ncbi:MAG: hypothetical protein KAV87_20765 [Desulfobacteraceae bacterium]|nr:hypothetical protein [Desulfobacteraceae bacterium]